MSPRLIPAPGHGRIVREIERSIFRARGLAEIALPFAGVDPADRFRSSTLLITGGGGSVAAGLLSRIAADFQTVVLLDQDDSALQRAARRNDRIKLQLILANVRDAVAVEQAFQQVRPQFVVHTAALKHVDLLETSPREALLTNALGSLNVFRSAAAVGAKLLNLSTDKAAEPVSVLGASKRIAERLLAHANRAHGLEGVSLRLGNVIGSRGSAIEAFIDRLAEGRALRLTDPRMERYFMSTGEVAGFTAWYLASAPGLGHTLAPKLGRAVTMGAVAEIVRKACAADISPEVVGVRVGERITEMMVGPGEAEFILENNPAFIRLETPELSPAVVEELGRHPSPRLRNLMLMAAMVAGAEARSSTAA